jgi:hypothetical protein
MAAQPTTRKMVKMDNLLNTLTQFFGLYPLFALSNKEYDH